MKTLHLVLKRKWYEMIESGEKKEEYREIKPYWEKRLLESDFTHVTFQLGYQKNALRMTFCIEDMTFGRGNPNWGAPTDRDVFIIKLGNRL